MISTALLNLASDMAIVAEMVMGDERQGSGTSSSSDQSIEPEGQNGRLRNGCRQGFPIWEARPT